MAVGASLRRFALLLPLLSLLLALIAVPWLCVDAAPHARAVSRSSGAATSTGRAHVPSNDDEEDQDDDDEHNAWDFLSDASIVAAVEAQRRAVPCATSLAAAYLNDDYCDCADGSDEPDTGACALVALGEQNLFFQCKSRDSDEQRVAASFVRDGVCDCCDGSDEAPGVCAHTCVSRRRARLENLQTRVGLVKRARVSRDAYAQATAPRLAAFAEQFEEIVGRVTALQRAFQYKEHVLQTHMDETGEQPSAQQLHELRGMYANLQYAQYSAYVQRKLTDRATFDEGESREAFASLVGTCFPFTVNEKQLKGGSSNVIPREYVVVLCPFQNVTQTEPGYAQWQRAERESKTGVHEHEDNTVEGAEQPAITMGVWDQWVDVSPATAGDETNPVVHRQRFTHGEPCANGQERAVHVDVLCGDENRVLSVEEPEMCVYAVQFETPAACSADHERALLKAIQTITQRDQDVEAKQPSSSSSGMHEEL